MGFTSGTGLAGVFGSIFYMIISMLRIKNEYLFLFLAPTISIGYYSIFTVLNNNKIKNDKE